MALHSNDDDEDDDNEEIRDDEDIDGANKNIRQNYAHQLPSRIMIRRREKKEGVRAGEK